MTLDDIKDGLLLAKMGDDKVFQVVLSKEQMRMVSSFAAEFSGSLKLLDQGLAIEWSRPE